MRPVSRSTASTTAASAAPSDADSSSAALAAELLQRWAAQLGCTAEELRSAIGEAGRSINDAEQPER